MNTWFSGTDTQTLKDEGATQNNFVSLIVNNEGKYTAAITRKVRVNSVSCGFFGEDSVNDNTVSHEYLEYYYLNVLKEKDNELDDRIKEIKEKKKKERQNVIKDNSEMIITDRKNTVNIFPQKPYIPISRQNTLFNNDIPPINIKNDNHNINNDVSCKEDMEEVSFSPDIIKKAIAQIMTGSILVNPDKFDANKWAINMCNTYTRVFGEDFTLYENWIDQICDFVMGYTIDETLPDTVDQEMLLASNLLSELYKLPQNDYIKAIEDRLTVYFE